MFEPIIKDMPHIMHGGDYNPDQWLEVPEVLKEDVRLMKLAHVNVVSIGIFAWKALEPEEGVYTFEWLDELFDRLEANGIGAFLATPSGARPAWMDRNHPEVLRMNADRVRNLHGERHNHCYTSPYYRKKTAQMNRMLAERYGKRKALKLWHVSNEYGGECHCPLCQEAFRDWLRERYHNDIHELNSKWWTRFWSHEFSRFEEIESPCPHGEREIHGLNLDWLRFVTYQTTDFMKNEIAPLKEITPDIPVTTNLMGTFPGFDQWYLSKYIDVVSWDSYPDWHNDYESFADTAAKTAFLHDLNRSLKHRPFLLMESAPSQVNWQRVCKLKRPGVHELVSVQAVAHGSDSVQYFQWRKGRGASEKFHGAVVDHYGKEDTRVFHEVAKLGENLEKMDKIVGTYPETEVAVIYDWDNRWAIDNLQGLNDRRNYEQTCKKHHRPFWNMGISTDVNDMNQDFSQYKLVVAPMLYMLKPDVAENIRTYVENGGTVVFTYCTGNVDESDLCFTGGFPGNGLMDIAGIWMEEVDPLYDTDRNTIEIADGQNGFSKASYECKDFCEIIHPQVDTEVLAVYGSDFYQGMAAVTKHTYGKGSCYYIATRTEDAFLEDFYRKLANELGLTKPPVEKIPDGVSVTRRCGDKKDYLFLMNYSEKEQKIVLTTEGTSLLSGQAQEEIVLDKYGYDVIEIELCTEENR